MTICYFTASGNCLYVATNVTEEVAKAEKSNIIGSRNLEPADQDPSVG